MVKMKDWILRKCKSSNYYLLFDKGSGLSVRSGFYGQEPFMNVEGPELLDISITNFCERGCEFCYRKSSKEGLHMPLKLYQKIISEAVQAGVLQVALGGGNPNQHPDFVEILKLTRQLGMIPSYTTNGDGMTDEIWAATREYCGAIAISYYEEKNVEEMVRKASEYGVKINIHYMLNRKTIEKALAFLKNPPSYIRRVNAIVFLNYKPVHSSEKLCLKYSEQVEEFVECVKMFTECKIGFDSCMVSFLPLGEKYFPRQLIDFCEAGRFSAFISETGKMYPCSFMNDTSVCGADITHGSLREIWKNDYEFQKVRDHLQEKPDGIVICRTCDVWNWCHGGCSIFPINKCGYGSGKA